MKSYSIVLMIVSLAATGCSQPTRLNEAPVAVSGKLSQGGQAVGDVQVSFQPLQQGHPVTLPVDANGSFRGELVPGKYAYFIAKSPLPKSAAAIKRLDSKYLEPNLTRSVDVQAGQDLAIALD